MCVYAQQINVIDTSRPKMLNTIPEETVLSLYSFRNFFVLHSVFSLFAYKPFWLPFNCARRRTCVVLLADTIGGGKKGMCGTISTFPVSDRYGWQRQKKIRGGRKETKNRECYEGPRSIDPAVSFTIAVGTSVAMPWRSYILLPSRSLLPRRRSRASSCLGQCHTR